MSPPFNANLDFKILSATNALVYTEVESLLAIILSIIILDVPVAIEVAVKLSALSFSSLADKNASIEVNKFEPKVIEPKLIVSNEPCCEVILEPDELFVNADKSNEPVVILRAFAPCKFNVLLDIE